MLATDDNLGVVEIVEQLASAWNYWADKVFAIIKPNSRL